MNKIGWFLIAQAVITAGVFGDLMTTLYGTATRRYVEMHPNYSPFNAMVLFTAYNLTWLVCFDKSNWKIQTLRFLAVGLSWVGMIWNLWMLTS